VSKPAIHKDFLYGTACIYYDVICNFHTLSLVCAYRSFLTVVAGRYLLEVKPAIGVYRVPLRAARRVLYPPVSMLEYGHQVAPSQDSARSLQYFAFNGRLVLFASQC
jgi:hypothetical protein